MLGVTFTVNGEDTDFPDGLPLAGDFVEVSDSNGDGIADTVELDD